MIKKIFSQHNIFSVLFGVFFIIALKKFSYPAPVFRFLATIFLAYWMLLGLYNHFYLKHIGQSNFWVWLRPFLISLSVLGVFFTVPNDFLRGMAALMGAFLVFLFEFLLGKFSDNLNVNETLLIAFGGFMALCGINFYFPGFSFIYVIMSFVWTVLMTRSFLEFIPQDRRVKLATALTLGFFSAQLYWALGFLPLHYSVLATALFCLYYLLLIFTYYYLFNILSLQKIKFHLGLAALCLAAIILATPWSIIQ